MYLSQYEYRLGMNFDTNIRDNEQVFPPIYSTDGSYPLSDDSQVQTILSNNGSFDVSDSDSITLQDKNIACFSSDDLSTTTITVNNNQHLTNHMNERLPSVVRPGTPPIIPPLEDLLRQQKIMAITVNPWQSITIVKTSTP